MLDWFLGEGMLFGSGLLFVLWLSSSALVLLFMVVSLANVSMTFVSGHSAGGHYDYFVIPDHNIVAFHNFMTIYPIPPMHIWINCVTC